MTRRVLLDVSVGFVRREHRDRPAHYRFLPGWVRPFIDVTDVPASTIKARSPLCVALVDRDMPHRIWMQNPTGIYTTRARRNGLKPDEFSAPTGGHIFHDVTEIPGPPATSAPVKVMVREGVSPARTAAPDKPPYRVPTMAEVAALRGTSGYRSVSTFSGCGGSCLGFEMAGFEVVWANEFDPHASATYRLNHPATTLDERGIRAVSVEDILAATGLETGALDVLEGSPPCSKFSTAGKRAASWGKVTGSDSTIGQANVEDLFFEFVRLLDGLRPLTFVAENVAGLNKGVAKGYLIDIIRGLKACGYRVKVGDLDAQWLGVPQRRRRLFFVGVREDLGLDPVFPAPLPYRYSVAEACPWFLDGEDRPPVEPETGAGVEPRHAAGRELARIKPGTGSDRYFSMMRTHPDEPSQTVLAGQGGGGTKGIFVPDEMRRLSIAELRRLCSFPDDFALTGAYAHQWARLGNAVPPLMARAVAVEVRKILDQVNGRT